VRTSGEFNDTVQHHAAGVLEGALTAHHIYPAYLNNRGFTFKDGTVPASVTKFMAEQDEWSRAQVAANPTESFWQHTGALLAQFDGLRAGYELEAQAGAVPAVPPFAFTLLNAVGDLFQIIPAVEKGARTQWDRMSVAERRAELLRRGHCSAIIKVPGALEDLFMSHSSWFEYANMNRIYKYYSFAFHAKAAANRISFSSYPGCAARESPLCRRE
jgi:hypothetical protein